MSIDRLEKGTEMGALWIDKKTRNKEQQYGEIENRSIWAHNLIDRINNNNKRIRINRDRVT